MLGLLDVPNNLFKYVFELPIAPPKIFLILARLVIFEAGVELRVILLPWAYLIEVAVLFCEDVGFVGGKQPAIVVVEEVAVAPQQFFAHLDFPFNGVLDHTALLGAALYVRIQA